MIELHSPTRNIVLLPVDLFCPCFFIITLSPGMLLLGGYVNRINGYTKTRPGPLAKMGSRHGDTLLGSLNNGVPGSDPNWPTQDEVVFE